LRNRRDCNAEECGDFDEDSEECDDADDDPSGRVDLGQKILDAPQDQGGDCDDEMDNRAAHPAIIYGPDCGRDGLTIN
jgi:hypothetical protein